MAQQPAKPGRLFWYAGATEPRKRPVGASFFTAERSPGGQRPKRRNTLVGRRARRTFCPGHGRSLESACAHCKPVESGHRTGGPCPERRFDHRRKLEHRGADSCNFEGTGYRCLGAGQTLVGRPELHSSQLCRLAQHLGRSAQK